MPQGCGEYRQGPARAPLAQGTTRNARRGDRGPLWAFLGRSHPVMAERCSDGHPTRGDLNAARARRVQSDAGPAVWAVAPADRWVNQGDLKTLEAMRRAVKPSVGSECAAGHLWLRRQQKTHSRA